MFRITLAVFVGLLISAVQAEEIPLKSIWALDMPGTQDIRKLEPVDPDPKREMERFSLDEAIRSQLIKLVCLPLNKPEAERPSPPSAFIVQGEGIDALRAVHAVIVKEDKAPAIKAAQPASLVFFSCSSGGRLLFDSIKVVDREVVVRFHYKRTEKKEPGPQLALIPLGKLDAGKYRVKYEVGQKLNDKWMASAPLSFDIEE